VHENNPSSLFFTKIKNLLMKNYIFFPFCLLVVLSACNKENSMPLDTQNKVSAQNQPNFQADVQAQVQAAALTPYDWSNLLVTNVTPINNVYVNGVGSVSWAGQNGATIYACSTDCSGFLNRLLTQSYGYTSAYYKTWMGVTRPLAEHYYNEIVTKDHFRPIKTVSEIQQGDFVAIKYSGNATNTGHCMLVAAAPTLRSATDPLVAGTTQYELSVMDCASSGHGSTDTRYATSDSGIGKGILRIYVGSNGTIAGYTWSTFSNSVYYHKMARPLVVGRLIP
jgi:hypothetical protein